MLASSRIICADCLEAMRAMEPCSVDAVITDPPYGLEFMGKEWDKLDSDGRDRRKAIQKSSFGSIMGAKQETPRIIRSSRKKCLKCGGYSGGPFKNCQCKTPQWKVSDYPGAMQRWHTLWTTEALRVAKPGCFLLAFGGTRTHHRLMCAIEDAGWEIRDTLMWLYGSGFPKSHNVGNAIDKKMGCSNRGSAIASGSKLHPTTGKARRPGELLPKYEGRTEQGKQWSGWGTALKPAWEPIILARKSIEGTVADNVLKCGCGGLNIDECRIGAESHVVHSKQPGHFQPGSGETIKDYHEVQGRWPANLLLDEEAGAMLDEQSGVSKSTGGRSGHTAAYGGGYKREYYGDQKPGLGDFGGASRFFYCAKASRKERNRGLEECGGKKVNDGRQTPIDNPYQRGETARQNTHPTVKPLNLMKYLCRLVTPPDGVILDPFVGSGTTCVAAKELGFNYIGIEKEAEYCETAKRRIAAAKELKAGQGVLFGEQS